MSFLDRWVASPPVAMSQESQESQCGKRENTPERAQRAVKEEEDRRNLNSFVSDTCDSARATGSATPATLATPARWIDMPDVVTLVEDLADEGQKPGKISRLLGLTRAEIITVLRRSGR